MKPEVCAWNKTMHVKMWFDSIDNESRPSEATDNIPKTVYLTKFMIHKTMRAII